MTTRRYSLRDDPWERIKDLLLGREGTVGVTAKDNRLFVEAVLYRYRAGIPWPTYPDSLAIFWWCIRASVVGQKPECGSECFSTWRKMRITNTQ
jgi:transposase